MSTFGYTTQGDRSAAISPGNMAGSFFTTPSDYATFGKATLYVNGGGNGLKVVIVLKSTLNIVSNGVSDIFVSSASGWFDATWTTPPTLSASTDYILMAICFNGFYFFYKTESAGRGYIDTSNSYSTPTNPTDASTDAKKYSIYVTYTAGGATGPAKLKTLNSLTTAKIKTINGLEIAKVKTINGLI